MKLYLFLLLCFNEIVQNSLQDKRHEYFLITTPMAWSDAKTYCRNNYTDLATVLTEDDWYRLTVTAENKGLPVDGWVGLFVHAYSWYWDNGTTLISPSMKKWADGQPDNQGGNQQCAAMNPSGTWADYSCSELKLCICYDDETESFVAGPSYTMNWYGASSYCRQHYTYLARAMTSTENEQIKQVASQQGTSWIALFRYGWLWSDGSSMINTRWHPGLPNNAEPNSNCGQVNNSLVFLDRPCNNLYNFFCHMPYSVQYRVIKLQIRGGNSVFDSAVQAAILQKIVQKLKDRGLSRETRVKWRVKPDGSIFNKKDMTAPPMTGHVSHCLQWKVMQKNCC